MFLLIEDKEKKRLQWVPSGENIWKWKKGKKKTVIEGDISETESTAGQNGSWVMYVRNTGEKNVAMIKTFPNKYLPHKWFYDSMFLNIEVLDLKGVPSQTQPFLLLQMFCDITGNTGFD